MPFLLGRKPRTYNPAIPAWSSLRTLRVPPEPAPPAAHNWLTGMPTNTGFMLNDSLGDCLIEGTVAMAPGMTKAYRVAYNGPVVTIETSTGKRLTTTRNHAVLTMRGFVAAQFLQEGDYVLSTNFPQAVARGMDDNFKDVPTRVEDIFETFKRIALTSRVKGKVRASVDFHGDAEFFKSQVDVVNADRFLESGDVSAFRQPERENRFVLAVDPSETFYRSSTTDTHYGTVSASTASSMSLLGESALLNRRPVIRANLGGFGGRPHLYASLFKPSSDNIPIDPHLPSELIGRFPSEVTLDQIVKVSWRQYAGHVYDLSTIPQWYIANGIITHNCTCAAIYHGRQVRSFNADGAAGMITEPDKDVLTLYERACGYLPSDPNTDQGGNEQAVLAWIYKHGLPAGTADKATKLLLAYLEVDQTNAADICEAIYLCGGAYIGFNVPQFVVPNDGPPPQVWDVQNTNTQIVGGHAVWVAGYDADGVDLISWGSPYRMTWAFWQKYVDECYATAWQDWVEKTGMTPLGLTVAQLEQQMSALRG